MPQPLAAEIEQTIRDHRLLDIDTAWADEIVFPYYDGLSIRNLAHTVARLLITKPPQDGQLGSSPLDPRLWESHWGEVRRVVLFVSDGLGWLLLNEIMAEDAETAQIVADLMGDGGTLTPITSIAPSTTAAALPCIWTGTGPAGTGMVGTKLFLREFSVLADMLRYTPVNGRHYREVLADWGLDFDTFLPPPTLAEVLDERQIPTYLLREKSLFGSGLSRLMHRGVRRATPHYGYNDLWIALRDLLRQTRRNRCFVSVYWSAVDGFSHLHGTATEHTITEIRRQLADLRATLAADKVGDGRTLFILMADHGHTSVPDHVDLSEHEAIKAALRCAPGGDSRFAHLYLRHDFRQPVIDTVRRDLGHQIATLNPADALAAGLFGPDAPYAETAPRLGDLTLIARAGVAMGHGPRHASFPYSMHAGLSDREMLVPLLLRRM
ncbi:MAG: alkaline phosphatase family protein [Anaerolineae bacterium]|nr:alkaline phosphatase family protein [Anaerolineae bacterium]